MVRFPNVKVDPWHYKQDRFKKYKRIPDDALFICAYLVFVNPIDTGESAFLRRIDGEDELWAASWEAEFNKNYMNCEHDNKELFESFGCLVTAPSSGDIKNASKTLLTHLFRSRASYNCPSNFVREGLIASKDYTEVVQSLKGEREEYARQAGERVTPLVKTAEGLGLSPRPSGESPYQWYARCPGTSHPIWINTESDTFGCPWCRKKGGVEELKAFVGEREKKGRK